MQTSYRPNQNPRVIIIQKLYGKFFNQSDNLTFTKHRFKKFIKDVVNGTIERDEIITDELNTHLKGDLQLSKLDKLFQIIIKSAVFELLYKTKTSTKIIIKEYLTASNSFLDDIASCLPYKTHTPEYISTGFRSYDCDKTGDVITIKIKINLYILIK